MGTDGYRQQAQLWTELFGGLQVSLRRLRQALRAVARAWDLNDAEALLLLCCYQSPPQGVAQQQLVQTLGMSPAQVSSQIEGLQQRGLVVSRRSARDRRQQLWSICPQRQEQVQRLCHELLGGLERHKTDWSPNELRHRLQRVNQWLDASAAAAAASVADPVRRADDQEAAA
jgi:DNA-binding MarR family transcriptional regulator